ncbi:unnamed protein product, partial [Prorocentrum cordatum]
WVLTGAPVLNSARAWGRSSAPQRGAQGRGPVRGRAPAPGRARGHELVEARRHADAHGGPAHGRAPAPGRARGHELPEARRLAGAHGRACGQRRDGVPGRSWHSPLRDGTPGGAVLAVGVLRLYYLIRSRLRQPAVYRGTWPCRARPRRDTPMGRGSSGGRPVGGWPRRDWARPRGDQPLGRGSSGEGMFVRETGPSWARPRGDQPQGRSHGGKPALRRGPRGCGRVHTRAQFPGHARGHERACARRRADRRRVRVQGRAQLQGRSGARRHAGAHGHCSVQRRSGAVLAAAGRARAREQWLHCSHHLLAHTGPFAPAAWRRRLVSGGPGRGAAGSRGPTRRGCRRARRRGRADRPRADRHRGTARRRGL